jgi:hypothetical protein
LNLIRVMPAKGQEYAMSSATTSPAKTIARLVGPLFAAIGLGILLNASFYNGAVVEAAHNPTLVYLSGIASLLGGLAILNAYRVWTADWRVIVTVLGWLCVIGGVIRIVLPAFIEWFVLAVYSGPTPLVIVAIIVLIVGGYLSFEGYRR